MQIVYRQSRFTIQTLIYMYRNQKIKSSNPLYGRGYFIEKESSNCGSGCGFRKAHRPLIPSNITDIESWEPKVMSSNEISKLTARCVSITDAFIKLDNYVDSVKKYNPSNHDLLRLQRMQNQSKDDPDKYAELIVQCVANPNKFTGTRHCLELVIGRQTLEEFISRNEWSEEKLKDYDIDTNLKFEPNELTVPFIPIYNGGSSSLSSN